MTEPDSVASNIPEFSVSGISAALKQTLEGAFQRVRVRGEISGFKRAASGHAYLALKDEKAVLDAVIWRGGASALRLKPEDGLEVICEGRLTTYAARSKYQLVVESMAVAGAGALLALLEERRRTLAAEGLFDEARKRPIPFLPDVIGVVTSPTGAVIRDILHRLADRFPRSVLVWPVLVQGAAAAEQVAGAIRGFNALPRAGHVPRPDLLIVARGGGSIEDLWAFNEEPVVRAAADSDIPLISAVGHETDTTLIDLAADRRAPTPTAAAEMAVPVRADLIATLLGLAGQLTRGMVRMIDRSRREVDATARGLPRPQTWLGEAAQRLDDRAENLNRMVGIYFERRAARLNQVGTGLKSPGDQIVALRARSHLQAQRLSAAGMSLGRSARATFERWASDRRLETGFERLAGDLHKRLDSLDALLESFSYRNVLARGYAVIRARRGAIFGSAEMARNAREVAIEFHDGKVTAKISGRTPPARRGGRLRDEDAQGSLL